MGFEINGVIWRIEYCNPSNPKLQRSDGTWTIGVTDDSLKTVFIANNLTNAMTDRVICHELTHVFSFENNCSFDLKTEEIIANFMSLYGRDIIYLADSIMSNLVRRAAA